jgi:putative cell wall-binding protein/GH25 family lysozyme M1 (1,4-beta-N-acetylmuramidase)
LHTSTRRRALPAALLLAAGLVVGVVTPASAAGTATSSPDAIESHDLGSSSRRSLASADAESARPAGLPGFDVSEFQKNPNFVQAKKDGARFALIKASEGVPGTYKNGNYTGLSDSRRASHAAGARAAGLVTGFYHFATPFYSAGAPQAQFFLDSTPTWQPGMIPPVLDMETVPERNRDKQGGECWGLSDAEMVLWIQSWVGTVVAQEGVQPIIYTNQNFWSACTGNSTAFPKDRLWVASYAPSSTNAPVATPPKSSFATWTFWQWSQTANSPFPGNQDVFNGTAAQLDALTRPAATAVGRVAGSDAFATAASIAASTFTPPVVVDGPARSGGSVPLVYVATRASYPDALSGGAAAGYGKAPVLLTLGNRLPAPTQAELRLLKPARIVVLGGPAAVSTAVEKQLAAFATGSGKKVTRLSGSDRFTTSAVVSAATFPAGRGGTAYVATGTNFPDALSGAALASGADAGPMLLTRPDRVPPSVASELARLRPARIVVLGGEAAVSAAVATQLATVAPVTRLSGVNRFATSARIAEYGYGKGADTAFLATGSSFPDALAGASAAGRLRAPVLLTQPGAVPPVVRQRLDTLDPDGIVVLGGPVAVSTAVEASL